ncbi:MAG: TetR family transcriptional regulator [Alphaproteobacteria bacterium]|nr:MAG: TetR family transcriptional regulator [Alphaproteobacteria bacterium]
MDLQQRRKIETTRLIHEAAVQLARERGVAAVTIEAICEAASVSQRTFFNYFAFKEAVFLFPPPPLPDEAVERFTKGKGDMLYELIDLLVAQAVEMSQTRWIGPLMLEIAETHPRLMPLQMAEFQKFEGQLQRLIAGRLDAEPDDVRAMALAGAMTGASRATFDRWRPHADADIPARVRESLEALVRTIRG